MTYWHRLWSLLALLVLLVGVPAMAASKHAQAMIGEIRKVDLAANAVTVASLPGSKERQMTFRVPADVQITHNDQKVAVADLKQGDRVTVEYVHEKGHFTAHSIVLTSSDPEPSTPEP